MFNKVRLRTIEARLTAVEKTVKRLDIRTCDHNRIEYVDEIHNIMHMIACGHRYYEKCPDCGLRRRISEESYLNGMRDKAKQDVKYYTQQIKELK
jgi:hypothetical protein